MAISVCGLSGVSVTRVQVEDAMRKMPKTPSLPAKEYYPDVDSSAYTGGMSPNRGIDAQRQPPLHWSVDELVHQKPTTVEVLDDNDPNPPPPRLRSFPSSKRSIMATRFCLDGSENFENPLARNTLDSMRDQEHLKHQLQKMCTESSKLAEAERIGLGHDMSGPMPPVQVAAVCPLHQVGRDLAKDPPQTHAVYLPQFGVDFPKMRSVRTSPKLCVTFYHQLSTDEITQRKWHFLDHGMSQLASMRSQLEAVGTNNPLSIANNAWRGPQITDLGSGGAGAHQRANRRDADVGPALMRAKGKKLLPTLATAAQMVGKLQKGSPTGKLTERNVKQLKQVKLNPTLLQATDEQSAKKAAAQALGLGPTPGGSTTTTKKQGSQPRKEEKPLQPEDLISNVEIAKKFFGLGREEELENVKQKMREQFTGASKIENQVKQMEQLQNQNWWEEDANLVRKDKDIFPLLKTVAEFFLGPGLTLPGMTKELEPTVAKLAGALCKDALQPEFDVGITLKQVQKLRQLADSMRLLAKKNNNLDMLIVALICKVCCTRLLKKRTGIVFSNVLKLIQRIAMEIGDPRNHNQNGKPGVVVSPHLIGLFSQLAAEVRKQNTGAVIPADQILAPDSMQSIQVLAKEIANKVDEINGPEIYRKAWKAKIDKVFDTMDRDGSGFVNRQELEKMYKPHVANQTKKFLIEELLDRFDADGDNKVSYAEWVCCLSEAERSGRYSVEELSMELSFFLKGGGASRLESLEFEKA
ncbi:unnamed protein product [Amoebophrya sp. A120]|nr:unnamed protein product [Amoebophrya sp. A120]|eukprot:GSA120T00006078001.1